MQYESEAEEAVFEIALAMCMTAVDKGQELCGVIDRETSAFKGAEKERLVPMITAIAGNRLMRGACAMATNNCDSDTAESFRVAFQSLLREVAADAGYDIFLTKKEGGKQDA